MKSKSEKFSSNKFAKRDPSVTCHGGFSLDESERRKWYNPEIILKSVGLKSGMIFVDVGSGEGFFSLLAAKMVGNSGKIYAVDIDAEAIERLKDVCARGRIKNVDATVGEAEHAVLCVGCADIVFYSMVLHDFNDPAHVLCNARQMLKPSGTLVDLDWKKQPASFGPPEPIRFSEQKASDLLRQAGFIIKTVREAGPYHYIITAKPNL